MPAEAAPLLPGVVVSAPKLTVETRIDRTVYDVTTDVQSSTGTLSDILTAIPSVDVDGDGNLSLRGDSNVLILVDGKPSALFAGSTAGENLQSIPAKDIVRIEVMTNPPPQYKADGVAGVINIITRHSASAGLAGTVHANYGSAGRYELGGNLSYGLGPWSAALSAGIRHDLRRILQSSDLITPGGTGGTATDNHNAVDQRMQRQIPPLALSVNFAPTDRQSLNLQLSRSGRGGLRTYTELTDATVPPGQVIQSSGRLSSGHDQEHDYDGKATFEQKFARSGETLAVTLHRSASLNREHYDYVNESTLPPAPPYDSNFGFREDNGASEADADYVLPLSKTQTVRLGYGYEQDFYDYASSGATIDPGTGVPTVNPNLVDDFEYRQRYHSGYASYEATAGAWDVLGGMRGELADTDGRQLVQGVATVYRYARLYPSLHVDRSLDRQTKLTFSAGRRVTRPQPEALNPYVDYEYTPNLRSGNANLRPQYTDAFEIGYDHEARRISYSATVYYRHNTDSVTDVVANLGNGVSLATKTNLPRDDASGVEASVSGHPVRTLTATLSGNLFRRQIDTSALGVPGLQSTTALNGKIKLDYRPTGEDSAQVLVTRTDRVLTPQGYVASTNIVNIGYRRQWTPALTATLTVSDLFDGQRFRRVAYTPTFTDRYQRLFLGRIVWVGATYSFGSSEKDSSPGKFEYDE